MTADEVKEAAALLLERVRLQDRIEALLQGWVDRHALVFNLQGVMFKMTEPELDAARQAAAVHCGGMLNAAEERLRALGVELEAAS